MANGEQVKMKALYDTKKGKVGVFMGNDEGKEEIE